MAVFMGLIIPLPFLVKRKLFTFISESPVIAKLQYGLKVSDLKTGLNFIGANEIGLDNVYIHPNPLC